LSDLRSALHSPSPHANLGSNYLDRATPSRAIQTCASWLYLASLTDLHEGHREAALDNVLALVALSNLHREEYRIVSQLTRVTTAAIALSATWNLTSAQGIHEDELDSLQRAWEAVDLLEGLDRAMQGERCFVLEAMKVAERQQLNKRKGFLFRFVCAAYMNTIVDNDLLFGLRNGQQRVLCIRELRDNRPWPEVSTKYTELVSQVEQKFERPERYLFMYSLVGRRNNSTAIEFTMRTEVERRIAVTALAIHRFKLRHGSLPETLGQMVPEFISGIPFDCISGKPMSYHLKADRGFVLYSFGQDATDDNGDPTPRAARTGLKLWDGRDVVWPTEDSGI